MAWLCGRHLTDSCAEWCFYVSHIARWRELACSSLGVAFVTRHRRWVGFRAG